MADPVTALRERFGAHASEVAIVAASGQTHTYGELEAAVAASTRYLVENLPDRVILLGHDYGLTTIATLLAAAATGKVVAPVTETRPDRLLTLADACGASVLLAPGATGLNPHPLGDRALPPLLEKELPGGGLVLFSSGSTGTPKAMLHRADTFLGTYLDRKPRRMRILLFLLFDHIGGLNTLFGALYGTLEMVVPPSRNPLEVASLIERKRIQILPTTPTFLNLLLLARAHEVHDLTSLRVITYGAEAMPAGLLERLRAAFPRARLIQTFGTSETGIARTAPAEGTDLRLDDPNQEYRVVDGELWLRSKTRALGYLNAANDRFEADGWFRTGDLVAETPDGTLRFLSRTSDLINVGGEKVYPAEIESFLLELPEVGACRVFGEPHPLTGQVVAAEIVPAGETDPATLRSSVRRHCRQSLAPFKCPVKITLSGELKTTARFKKG